VSDPLIDANDDAATPLTPEEREALIPTHIAMRSELNAMEQFGIDDADRWAFSRKRDVLDEDFLRQLHRRMFRDVWTWAEEFRETEKNIGDVPWWRVPADLRQLLGDVCVQFDHKGYPPDEIALRFHDRLTWIHPFPNGNGRLARMAADLLAVQLGEQRFTCGSGNLVTVADLRKRYVDALRAADGEVIGPLMEFARS
jgi:Fic-DOC domain mobile mystery protein B